MSTQAQKPILLHCGADIRWNHDLYKKLQNKFTIVRSHSMSRQDFIAALKNRTFGDFAAIYRPFWSTGGEMSPWNKELIDLLPSSCEIYASAGAGFDWVDTEALAKKGVVYCNAGAACTESVADTAIWLILSVMRDFTYSSIAARRCTEGAFKEAQRRAALTRNPRGHMLGIIGLGKIGQSIAKKANVSFGMKIVYNDVRQLPESVETECGGAEYYKELDEMLGVADVVLVATPFGGEAVINAEKLSKMKKGSRLINIARGKLIDEKALVAALKSGHLAGAGLDVHFDEPHVNPELAAMDNVEMLSHTAGASVDSHMGFETLGMENILQFFETGKAISPVNLHFFEEKAKL